MVVVKKGTTKVFLKYYQDGECSRTILPTSTPSTPLRTSSLSVNILDSEILRQVYSEFIELLRTSGL